jgi:drug/metabolite transporter (DMT)-like permease
MVGEQGVSVNAGVVGDRVGESVGDRVGDRVGDINDALLGEAVQLVVRSVATSSSTCHVSPGIGAFGGRHAGLLMGHLVGGSVAFTFGSATWPQVGELQRLLRAFGGQCVLRMHSSAKQCGVLTATLLALGSAVLHAGWNFALKQGGDDRYLLLWGQFFLAGLLCAPVVFYLAVAKGQLPAASWVWVALSGAVHLPYCVFLAKAYSLGEFSLVYPIARGGGALLAAVGGVLFANDKLSLVSALGIAVVVGGLFGLAGPVRSESLNAALIVAVCIGVYSVSDARGNRSTTGIAYALTAHIGTAITTTIFGLVTGKAAEMRRALSTHWQRLLVAGIASTITYAMVQIALRRAPVGYVTALRESSVLIAAFIGWRTLGERAGKRLLAVAAVFVGLIVVVLGRN